MQMLVSAQGSSSAACKQRCFVLISPPLKSSNLYLWHCIPNSGLGSMAEISRPPQSLELLELRFRHIHLVSCLCPFSCGLTYLNVCSRIVPLQRPTRADAYRSMYDSCGPRPNHSTSSKPCEHTREANSHRSWVTFNLNNKLGVLQLVI